jgi:hypothetical protein
MAIQPTQIQKKNRILCPEITPYDTYYLSLILYKVINL